MAGPNTPGAGPPVDDLLNLSIADVEACLWWLWTGHFGQHYSAPQALMAANIKGSFPASGGLPADPDGRARKFLQDLQFALEAYTGYRANVGFSAFKSHRDGDKTWGQFAALVHSKAMYTAGLQRAKALGAISPAVFA